jgi:hypothetical protein
MHILRHFLVVVSFLGAGTSFAATTASPVVEATEQPGLAALIAPRSAELREVGIQQIIARTGKQRRDIQVMTQYGSVYFAWPKNVAPVTFEVYLGNEGRLSAYASDFNESSRAQYLAAIDAIFPEAMRGARNAKARALRPKP